jgi:hypothetical protein
MEQAKEVSRWLALADSPAQHDFLDDLCSRGRMGTVYRPIYEYPGVYDSSSYYRS